MKVKLIYQGKLDLCVNIEYLHVRLNIYNQLVVSA